MKTLTLFRAYKKATLKRRKLRQSMRENIYSPRWLEKQKEWLRVQGQQHVFSEALTKRLQEQEEKLERIQATNYLIEELYYALVGGNTANEDIPRDAVGQSLKTIQSYLRGENK